MPARPVLLSATLLAALAAATGMAFAAWGQHGPAMFMVARRKRPILVLLEPAAPQRTPVSAPRHAG